MSRITRASLIIAFFFAIDKVLGLLRQVLFNRTFGPAERDIFFVSNNIPDLLSALISGGALGMALDPRAHRIPGERRPPGRLGAVQPHPQPGLPRHRGHRPAGHPLR